jgi:hypothetical protein
MNKMQRRKRKVVIGHITLVLIVVVSFFVSYSVFAATSCSGVVFPATSSAQCTSFCMATGPDQHAYWSAGGYTGVGSSGEKCCCTGSIWDESARAAAGGAGAGASTGASGSRAVTPGVGSFGGDKPEFENPLGNEGINVPFVVGRAIRFVLGIIGSIALVIFLYGGMQWMTAFGEESKIKKGWETMLWAGLGMVIIFGSYVAVQFLLKTVIGS